ncbi:MAG: putative metal-dependent hydrolase [Marinoscillum sp.]
MTDQELNNLKYPVGKFTAPEVFTSPQIGQWIDTIAQFPLKITNLTKDLSQEELNWKYRPEGWTIKQVVHHCGDSHINSLVRFKLALTEEVPDIRPYHEDRWAQLNDSLDDDISDALGLLTHLHAKWHKLLRSLNPEELKRKYRHPEHGRIFTLEETIGIYAWHCEHHEAHIKQALANKGKFNATDVT